MRRALTGTLATIVVALACAVLAGCGGGGSDEPPSKRVRDSAKANCKGNECTVRFTCKGKVTIRRGTAPVRIRSSKTALVTTIIADFAGSRDAVVRC